jgi:hypothetical protein
MMCEICGRLACISTCPNYRTPKANYFCDICGDGITEGVDYVENVYGDYAHTDCVTSMSSRNMLQWAGCKPRIMGGLTYDD